MAVAADGVWAEDALRVFGRSLYPAALRMTGSAPDAISSQLLRAESHSGSAEDLVVGRLLNSDLTAALRALPHRHRVVVYLADLQGLGYQQISALTGIPLGSVKSCLHRARNRLRAELGAYASQG
jgi:RNA polymerase sigma-70 factor (ECF subfamily)